MNEIAILIPAAGRSSRMRGADKLLEEVDGLPLLRRQVLRALDTGAHVAVTLPSPEHPRLATLQGLDVQLVFVPDADEGMAASIRRGVAALPTDVGALMVLPADMPELETGDLLRLIDGFRAEPQPTLQQATSEDGQPGHPVLFPADCLNAMLQLTGDQGARPVLKANQHRLRLVPLEGDRALIDLDTPEAWDRWKKSRTYPATAKAGASDKSRA